MNQPVIDTTRLSPLAELLNQQFSVESLLTITGEQGAGLDFALWRSALYGPLAELAARPGKEFRAALVKATWNLAGGRGHFPEALGQLVEALHLGSLVIDDIEDNSAWRRGAPALHCQLGMPIALNLGNWLYFWALDLVQEVGLGPHAELQVHRWLNRTLLRCHYGQALDLRVRVADLPQAQVPRVVRATTQLKTGCLLEFSAALGAIAAGASRGKVGALAVFGKELGVGLQMLDDHGGLVSERRCHKGHEDLRLSRPTWPWAWVAESARVETFVELQQLAREVAAGDLHPEELAVRLRQELRRSGRPRIQRHLRACIQHLRWALGPSPALGELRLELGRLEQSYE